MRPDTERAIRRLERYHVRIPGSLFKGAIFACLGLAAFTVGLWLIGFISRHLEALFR